MASYDLSTGCLRRWVETGVVETPATLQLVHWREVPNSQKGRMARVQLSDGVNCLQQAVVSGDIVEALDSNTLAETGILVAEEAGIKEAGTNSARVLVIRNARILAATAPKIGANLYMLSLKGPAPTSATASGAESSRPAALAPTNPPPQQPLRRPATETAANEAKKPRMDGTLEIRALNPYINKWQIRARCTNKAELREWSNSRGTGSLFNMELTDQSGVIRATAFKDQAQRFFPIISSGRVYEISGGNIKPADKRYNSTSHDYELVFNHSTEVRLVEDATDAEFPGTQYNFISSISALQQKNKDDMVDVIGVLKSVAEPAKLTSRAGKELVKRELVLVDQSKATVQLTLWGATAEGFPGVEGRVLAAKSVKLGDFGGISLSTVGSSHLDLDPSEPKAHELAGWWSEIGNENLGDVQALSSGRGGGGSRDPTLLPIGFVEAFGLGTDPSRVDYFNLRATVMHVKSAEALYKSCPADTCNKRVVETGTDAYRCEKCGQDYDKFKYAAMIQLQLMDMTGTHWLTLFGPENCRALTGKEPSELGHLKENEPDAYDRIFNGLMFQNFVFRLSARQETYNDNVSVKWRPYSVRRPTAEDEAQYVKQLEEALEIMNKL